LKTTKAPAKAAPKKRAKPDSDLENSDEEMDSLHDDTLLSNTPPVAKKQKKAPAARSGSQPLAELENEAHAVDGAAEPEPKKKGATDQYQKLTQLEHILKRPDTYIGSVESTTEQMWAFNSETVSMENRKVSFVPGLYKIFDEILVNAADNKQRDKNMNELKVEVNREEGVISVRNNGRGIPVEMHEKEGIWIPEMIFGHLLTSSNYDDEEAKVTGGRNGYGAKLTNIYSTEFTLETVDSKSKQRYRQTWRNNMSLMEKAKIDKVKGDDYTKITFKPDFKKFGMDEMDDDFEALVKRRVYDMAGTCTGIKVFLNGERIKINKFKQYMEMYTKAIKTENLADNGSAPEQVILTDNPHERWEIGFAVSDGSFQQVSFVNSIATTHGGTHVNYVADQIIDKLEEIVMKKNKGGVKLKKAQIKNHIFLFVNCLIVNPAFTSQTKEQLTTKASAFGSKPQVTDKFLKDIAKTEAVTNIIHFAQQKADKVLSKSDGNRRQRMNNSKLTDANKAGTKDGYKCTLILTEGDSASGLALAGRAVVNPDLFGVFPLRGKMLNVRDASIDQISKNAEIQNIKKFMGLQHKKDYADTKGLRYGHLMIMTDQDHDGSHIKGLLINFLQVQFPSLLKLPGFLMEFITPIVKVWKGDPKHPKSKRDFFTMPEYEGWKAEPGHQKGWDHKYFKGLGTSDTTDAEIYFADLDKHLKEFHTMQEGEPELIDLAFSKKKADARKGWLQEFKPGTYLDMAGTDRITYNDFINKELILFSMADNQRSIPSVVDGFKPGQRKVLYTCFRRNLKKDIKVVELAGSVSGLTAYSYGETSLQQTIVGLAQNYVGSNNINCLEPSGNFGSRLQGGQDAASARYIYTRLSPFARRIFHQSDEPLLKYNTDDGKQIEPEMYVPIVPMILINGADGIGTGWSTSIPNYNPVDVIENLKARMHGGPEAMSPMKPWFRGWTGEVEDVGGERYKFGGRITETGECEVEITELPVRLWTQTFKDRLEEIIKAEKTPSFIKDYTEYNTPAKVHFIVKLEESKMKTLRGNDKALEETFKLSSTMATTNMVAFDKSGRIKKYTSPLEIMDDFYEVRIEFYQKRRKHMLAEMESQRAKLTNQARFVKAIIDGDLVVSKKKKAVLVAELDKAQYMRFPKIADAKKQGEFEAVVEQEEDESDDAEVTAGANDFDYLLGMAIWSLTQERVDRLNGQIADKEAELDVLLRKSPKDLWTADLDDLLEEWQTQLDEAEARAKKVKNKGRRTSAKLGIGAKAGKKRKADSDDDSDAEFVTKKAKAAPKAAPKKKGAASSALASMKVEELADDDEDVPMVNAVEQKPVVRPAAAQQMTLDSAFDRLKSVSSTSTPEAESRPTTAGAAKKAATKVPTKAAAAKAPATKVPAKAAPKKKVVEPVELSDEDEDEDDFLAIAKEAPAKLTAARGGRAAAQKAKSYKVPDDSDEDMSDGNDRLDDVSAMVKGIGAGAGEGATRFFHPPSAVRPTSSGLKAKKRVVDDEDISDDETDWAALAQNSPMKATDRTLLSEEGSDDMEPPTPKPAVSKLASKLKATTAAPKTNGALKPKKASAPAPAPAPAAPKTLSPAAKAYAAKQAKAGAATAKTKAPASRLKKVISDDEDDDVDESVDAIANDILSDDDEDEDLDSPAPVPAKKSAPAAAAARPSRRAAAAKPKARYAISDEEDEDDFEVEQESEEEESFDGQESD
jgi:DNA topoisomerase-2